MEIDGQKAVSNAPEDPLLTPPENQADSRLMGNLRDATDNCSNTMDAPEMDGSDGEVDVEDLPTAVIVANMEPGVFSNMELRTEFESLFRQLDENVTFQYLKSFRRVRVNFVTPQAAIEARIQFHDFKFGENKLSCYFVQQSEKENNNDDPHLRLPMPYKQFLISPPASPPVGWEPILESEPTINYDVLSALANLQPGGTHELHPQSEKHPSIIVHVCDRDRELTFDADPAPKMVQTSRPPLPHER